MRLPDWKTTIGFILLCQGAGLVGSVFTAPNIPSWYASLMRPELAPPNWVFAPVWTTLFLLMGIAVSLVWVQGSRRSDVRAALAIFLFQLVLNVLWSYIFFGLQSPGAAFAELLLLWSAIATTIIAFWHISRTAALLLVPYICWVTFAGYLNLMIYLLN